jgi:DNA-binding SARP family transcriptional activator
VTSLSSANPWSRPGELTTASDGNWGFLSNLTLSSLKGRVLEGPLEGGSAWRKGPYSVLETLGVPRDPRGIVLLCGYVAACAVGLIALLTPPDDPIGWAYIALAAVGYFFIQTRGLTTFLWLLVAAGGTAIALAGGPSGWVEFGLGLALAVVALVPVPAAYRTLPISPEGQIKPLPSLSAKSDSSRFPEVSPTHTSRKTEEPGSNDLDAVGLGPVSDVRLELRSIGRLRVVSDHKDLAASIEDRPVLAFLFKYLLARYVLGRPPLVRDGLGEELSPGVPQSSQRKRLRRQLYDLQKDIASPIAVLIHASRTHVWLELDDADFDVAQLRDLANQIRQRGSMIDAELAVAVQGILDETEAQEFLPGFEELENKVNGGRGTAGQLVAEARELIANQRAELVRALAEYQEAIGHPEASIGYLQAALNALPARQDLARLLVVAYLKTGQTARASEVRRQFALRQEE